MEKVYVVLGNESQEGFSTLEWALKKWSSRSISVVILYTSYDFSPRDLVYTRFGKIPASYASDEKIESLKKMKEIENEKLLSKYKGFCGKVKVEIIRIEKSEEPFHKLLVELISRLRITKLVTGISCMKSSSWKCKGTSSGSFYVHNHKPNSCELFVIHRGKLVFLREENNEGIIEDAEGLILAKIKEKKSQYRSCLEKISPDGTNEKIPTLPSSSTNNNFSNQWEHHVEEIESYSSHLQSLRYNEEDYERENETLGVAEAEIDELENTNPADNIEILKDKISKAHDLIKLKRKEARVDIERHSKSEWAISLCTRRAKELEDQIKKEIQIKVDTNKDLGATKEEIYEIQTEVEDKRRKIESVIELQHELSNKLRFSSLAKTHAELQLEKAITKRAEMVHEIEELRRQRDICQLRIEFCKEKDALGAASRFCDSTFSHKKFTVEEIRLATDSFSEHLRFKSGGDVADVYRGRLEYETVAIKMYNSGNGLSQEDLQEKVKFLRKVRHPNLVAMLGCCSELSCIVYEYMRNGCLRDALFTSPRSSRNMALNWHARIYITAQVSVGLGFLHSAKPRPIVHGKLSPSRILLDRHLVAKIYIDELNCQSEVYTDIQAFGNLVMQLLTGCNWAGLLGEAEVKDRMALVKVLDEKAGSWPLDLAVELAGIAMRCMSVNKGDVQLLSMEMVVREIKLIKRRADNLMVMGDCNMAIEGGSDIDDLSHVPDVFLCPILKDVMKNPHIAADGYSYELEAIEEWFRIGNITSPMTNLKLNHKQLTPNQSLRSFIYDWHNKRSITLT